MSWDVADAAHDGPAAATIRTGRAGIRSIVVGVVMQSAQPRDLGLLVLVVGLFAILFVISIVLGSPSLR